MYDTTEKKDTSTDKKLSMMESKPEPTTTTTVPEKEHEMMSKKQSKKEISLTFEQALELTKFGKFNYLLIVLTGVILTSVLLETLGISYILPVSECDMKLTTQDKGILSAIGFAGIIASSHLWGFLADTTGRRKVIMPTLLVAFTCTVLSSFTQNFWVFLVLRFLNGFFISGSSATIYALLSEYHTLRFRSRVIMCASVIFGLCCVLLPLLAWLVINQEWEFYIPYIDVVYKPWRLFLIVCGLPGLLSGLVLIKIPESPKFVLSQGKQAETIEILQTVNRINNGSKEPLNITYIIEEIESINNRNKKLDDKSVGIKSILKSMKTQTLPLFMAPNLKQTVIACIMQFGIYTTSNGMYMWFPEILNRLAEYSETNPNAKVSICHILSATKTNLTAVLATEASFTECTSKLEISTYEHSIVLELLYAIGFAFIGLLINVVGKFPILFFVLAGCGVCGILTVFVNIPILATYLYLILLMCGLGITVVNAACIDLYPTNLRAMAVCISLMMGRLGSVVGSYILGVLLDNYCESAFILSGVSLILCSILAFFIPNIRSKNSKEMNQQYAMGHRHSITSVGR